MWSEAHEAVPTLYTSEAISAPDRKKMRVLQRVRAQERQGPQSLSSNDGATALKRYSILQQRALETKAGGYAALELPNFSAQLRTRPSSRPSTPTAIQTPAAFNTQAVLKPQKNTHLAVQSAQRHQWRQKGWARGEMKARPKPIMTMPHATWAGSGPGVNVTGRYCHHSTSCQRHMQPWRHQESTGRTHPHQEIRKSGTWLTRASMADTPRICRHASQVRIHQKRWGADEVECAGGQKRTGLLSAANGTCLLWAGHTALPWLPSAEHKAPAADACLAPAPHQ